MKHISVMLDMCIDALKIKEDGIYIDATLGRAGHSKQILKQLNSNGKLYCFDKDDSAIEESKERLDKIGNNFEIIKADYKDIDLVETKVDGILFDLGVSSPQLDEEDRGFSYHGDARLDMRMDQQQELDAYKVVNEYSQEKLEEIFRQFGQEQFARRIAEDIVKQREEKKIETTSQLVDIIKQAKPEKFLHGNKHPARQVFQAIRIEVNTELDSLKEAIKKSLTLLKQNGIIVVLTYHSLEDAIVKDIFWKAKEPENYLMDKEFHTKKVKYPSKEEVELNPRARSAKMRTIIKK